MAGLLSNILSENLGKQADWQAQVNQYGSGLKSKLMGLLQDPAGSLNQFVGHLGEQTDRNSALMQQTGWAPTVYGKSTATQQQQALARALMADQGAQMGIAGSIGGKFVYPQEKALATAQRNAALPVEKGGLGLHPNNTPAERAQAMGFNSGDLYHGTKADIQEFSTSRGGEFGSGVYSAKDPGMADMFASFASGDAGENVIPLLSRAKNALVTADRNVPRGLGTKGLAKKGFDSVDGIGATGQVQNVVIDPALLRSRFAAFDPIRKNSPDLLAGMLPLSMMADEDQRSKLMGLLGR